MVLLLLMFSTNVLAEFTEIGGSSDGVQTVYVDFGTIKRKGNKVKMWSLNDFKAVQSSGNVGFLSTVTLNEYDCEEETKHFIAIYWYSGNMRQGEVVTSLTSIKEEPHSLLPGSIEDMSLKIACLFKK